VATTPEIFVLKALVSSRRSKSRDWFDLYTLFKDHGYRWKDYHEVFMRHSHDYQYVNAPIDCVRAPQADDEGYKT